MATNNMIHQIAELLRNSGLPWLLPNLRQDFVVWNALNDHSFFEKIIQANPATPADFAPGKLALLALDQSELPKAEGQYPLDSMDEQIVQIAIKSADERATLGANAQDLATAGLMALSWFNKYKATRSWQGLLDAINDKPLKDCLAPIACLYGYIEHPVELLQLLVNSPKLLSHAELAVHALLSNPLTVDEQVNILVELFRGVAGTRLPIVSCQSLLLVLTEQRAELAQEFCKRWLEISPEFQIPSQKSIRHPVDFINELSKNNLQFEIRRIAGASEALPELQECELSLAHSLYTGLVTQSIHRGGSLRVEKPYRNDVVEKCEKAIQLSELNIAPYSNLAGKAELALVLAEQGLFDEAERLLRPLEEAAQGELEVLYAIAKVSFLTGNQAHSLEAVLKLLELLDQRSKQHNITNRGDGFSLMNLGNLLMDLHKPSEAAQVFEQALVACPNDADLLTFVANSYRSAHQGRKTAEALKTLVEMRPDDLDNRRAYAKSLEDLGDWEASLPERLVILETTQKISGAQSLQDAYKYAQCAINSNQPALALKICDEILANNREDSQALIFTGEAYLLMDENDKGMEFLACATQISPGHPEAWLALANAQKKIYPYKTVIETLKNAIQAVPDSPAIHYALGDSYLLDAEPVMALPELRIAVELSPDTVQFLVRYGEALNQLGHAAESCDVFAQAFQLEPGYPGLAQGYSKTLLNLGDLEKAIAPLETLISSKNVRDISPYLDYARCILTLHHQGFRAHPPMKALVALNEVLQIEPDHAEAKALTAEALAANGENELAFQAYREALDTTLTCDKAWFERLSFGFGCVAIAIGKQDIAIAVLQEACQANPNNPAIFMALSDAYIAAGLPEDAMRAARTVLSIEGENPDKLAWFANQVAKLNRDNIHDIFNSKASLPEEVITEALSALAKAIQLAPTRSDLLVQLGTFQAGVGQVSEAQATFASIALHEYASVRDLMCAAHYLSDKGDHISAIACLEQGMIVDQRSVQIHDPALYDNLAQEYVKNHDHPSAINILDKAIELIPGDNTLIMSKAEILLGLGQPQDALHVIETALQKSSEIQPDVDLSFLASSICRCMGDFATSIQYARLGASAISKKGPGHSDFRLPIQYRTHIAEIYRALLQPEQAYQILQEERNTEPGDFTQEGDYLDFIFLHSELALETGERIRSDIQDIRLDAAHPDFSRLMAINARLMNKSGNHNQAEQLYHLAFNAFVNSQQSSSQSDWFTPYRKLLILYALIEAAQDLGVWDQAINLAQQAESIAPEVPLSRINLVKTIVLKAEFRHLCEVFEVTRHLPAIDTQGIESYQLCQQYLEQTSERLGKYIGLTVVSEHDITDGQIKRWQARADIIFGHPYKIDPGETLAHRITVGDTTAIIHFLTSNIGSDVGGDALTKIIKYARAFPRNPLVILHVALALQDHNPQDALKSLQSVIEHNPNSKNPALAFGNVLLAKLGMALEEYGVASEAVEKAIAFWPEEDHWHALAAQINLHTSDVGNAIRHLQQATNFAPENTAYHIELGRVLFESANDDISILKQAQTSFETALNQDSQNIQVLIYLAKLHYLSGDLDEAGTHARAALLLAPDRPDLYQLLSKIAIEMADYQSAYEYAGKAVQISPKDIPSTVLLARSLSALGRHDEALAKLNAVIPMVQEARSLHLVRVDIIRKVSGPQIALNELKTLTVTYPGDFNILNELSKSFVEVGELDSAVAVALQALRAQSEQVSTNERANLHLLVGQVQRETGLLDQSIQHLNEAIQLAPNRLEPYLELGLARKERREYQQALQVFEQATEIAPNDPRAPFQAGLALKESKDYKLSETMLRKAVNLAPNDLAIRRQLAAVVALNLIHNPRTARNNAK